MFIFTVLTSKFNRVPFTARDWPHARELAAQVGGKNHRGITLILPEHRLHAQYKKVLGL